MELREGGGVARPRRTADERRAGREWARRSADRAVLKFSEELARTRDHLAVVEDALAVVAGCDEVGQRLRALLPALRKKLAGRAPTWLETLRRNVALHADAEGVDLATAGGAALKRAQKGPRLEARLAAERGSAMELSPDAAPFVPASFFAPGAWDVEQLADGDLRVSHGQLQEQEVFDGSEVPLVGGGSDGPVEEVAEASKKHQVMQGGGDFCDYAVDDDVVKDQSAAGAREVSDKRDAAIRDAGLVRLRPDLPVHVFPQSFIDRCGYDLGCRRCGDKPGNRRRRGPGRCSCRACGEPIMRGAEVRGCPNCRVTWHNSCISRFLDHEWDDSSSSS